MIQYGIEQLLTAHRHLIAHKRFGLITHYAMTDGQLTPIIDRFQSDAIGTLVRLFGPEHGVLNASREGEPIGFAQDAHSQLPAVSLYGEAKAPSREMLQDLDLLIIDLQDIGARYYTNASTLYYVLAAAENIDIPVVVLDRPNPLGGLKREGPLLDMAYQSFVGILPVPHRHGLTLGEQAQFMRDHFYPRVRLTVIPMSGWERAMLWPETGLPWVSPSPNVTHFDMALLYPGTCLFEGTNVSVGRGTTHPFEWLGAPWADGHQIATWFNAQKIPGVIARPVYFTPWRSLYAGDLVQGVQLHVVDARQMHALKAGIVLLDAFHVLYPDTFHIGTEDDGPRIFFDLLAGGPALRQAIHTHNATLYLAGEAETLKTFAGEIAPYLLYP